MDNDRIWWTDEEYKERLNEKVATNKWLVSCCPDNSPGKVVKVIYAGYKVEFPDGSTQNVHPSKTNDITEDEYNHLQVNFFNRKREYEENLRRAEEARLAKVEFQRSCQHEDVSEDYVVRVAGCDIMDMVCNKCGKTLRRSWSTAYENDPNSHISDWDWYLRYCAKQYNGWQPNRSDYEIVDNIGNL